VLKLHNKPIVGPTICTRTDRQTDRCGWLHCPVAKLRQRRR